MVGAPRSETFDPKPRKPVLIHCRRRRLFSPVVILKALLAVLIFPEGHFVDLRGGEA